jgi:hypothetical protein
VANDRQEERIAFRKQPDNYRQRRAAELRPIAYQKAPVSPKEQRELDELIQALAFWALKVKGFHRTSSFHPRYDSRTGRVAFLMR